MDVNTDNRLEQEYANGLARNMAGQKTESAIDNILTFYKENEGICTKAYQYYKGYEENKAKYVKEPIRLTQEEFIKHLEGKKILVLTANPIERGVFLRWLAEKGGSPTPLETFLVGRYSYNVYKNVTSNTTRPKVFSIIHVNPGKTGEDPTRRAINQTCKVFQPDCIISLGICYGFNHNKFSIGYVFLSENLSVFRVNYRDENGGSLRLELETEFEKQPSYNLIQSINERIMYIMAQNFLSDANQPIYAQMKSGKFLSIDSLMSSKEIKMALLEQFGQIKPVPLGGEMEGQGILKSDVVQECDYSNWLVVKSICDWGEAKNSLDEDAEKSERIKDSLQAFSMANACSVFDKILVELCEV